MFHTYADHRMAHAGVIVGAAVDGVLVENVDTTAKTFPGFAGYWVGLPVTGRYSEHDHEHYERPRRRTRPRTKERPDATTTPSRPSWSPSTAAATPCCSRAAP